MDETSTDSDDKQYAENVLGFFPSLGKQRADYTHSELSNYQPQIVQSPNLQTCLAIIWKQHQSFHISE